MIIVDVDKLRDLTTYEESGTTKVDVVRYEMYNLMIDTVFSIPFEFDDSLGFEKALEETPFNFRIALDTLMHYEIIKEV
jgi:hypothetical protein